MARLTLTYALRSGAALHEEASVSIHPPTTILQPAVA